MRLTHLDLTNFRSFRGTSLDLDASRVIFTGKNGTGKSSTGDGISWALTGVCKGTDGRGAGADVLIPEGEKIAEVVVGIEGIGKVSRSYAERGGGAFSVEGFTGTSQVQSQALLNKLNTTPEFLRAVLSTEAFLDLSHVEAKAMVLSLLNVKFQIDSKDLTLDELEIRYKQAFEDRKAAKKALANCVVPQMPSTAQIPTIQAIEDQLGKLRADLGALQKVTGSVTGRRQALQDEQKRLEATLAVAVGEDLSGQIDGLQAKLASLEAAMVPVQTDAPKKGDPERLQFLRAKVGELQRYEPSNQCVLEAGIVCKTPTKAFRDRLVALNEELRQLDLKPEKTPEKVAASPLTVARSQLYELQRQQLQRTQRIEAATQAEGQIQQIRQGLDTLPSTADQEKEIAVLSERIGKGEQLLKDARTHWHAVETYADAVKRQTQQKAEVDRLEALVEQLGPNGIRVQALADAMGSFEAAVNPYLEAFGWKIGFSVDPWHVTANGRGVETYSESEKFRIGVALQLGIAMLSGLKFAIIDRLDQLDVANRTAVTKMLLAAPLDQILIMSTREPSQALSAIPGVIGYRLEKSGQSSIIAERSAA